MVISALVAASLLAGLVGANARTAALQAAALRRAAVTVPVQQATAPSAPPVWQDDGAGDS